ncbi:MAG: hypothetical protein POELPBGB_02668 [Bacteroidia bacterium]|nr:hypothetical protein [Bacteroidia bacterium]
MKKLIILFAASLAIYSCSNGKKEITEVQTFYGEEFKIENPVAATALPALAKEGKATDVVVTGKINEACKKKGCWMTIDLGNNEEMRVTFKDYGFFVPKDCDGKEATFKGTATFDTTSVADLQHYASDEGLSQEEIDKITEPEIALVFEATGVVIK